MRIHPEHQLKGVHASQIHEKEPNLKPTRELAQGTPTRIPQRADTLPLSTAKELHALLMNIDKALHPHTIDSLNFQSQLTTDCISMQKNWLWPGIIFGPHHSWVI